MTSENRITSNRAFILAIAGAAIGLGNIWRFPYVAGENGGSLFFLLYLVFVIVMGLPMMIAEIIIGRAGRASPASSLRLLAINAGGHKQWSKVAWLGTLAATLILSFYSVIAGWALYYLLGNSFGQFNYSTVVESGLILDQLLLSPSLVIIFHTLFIVMTFAISGRAVSKGIERLNNVLMPLMYLILVLLVLYASGFSGFSQAVDYLFSIKVQAISGGMLIEAMGHAFFTLAVGGCCLMAYGAYMPDNQSVIKAVFIVAVLDILVAVMVGLATFSVVFTEGVAPGSGPGLMFITLPVALVKMPFGSVILPLFFLLLVIATWTSSVNLAEPLVVMVTRLVEGNRSRGAMIAAGIVWLMGLVPALAFNVWNDMEPLPGKNLFDVYTAFPTQVLLPVTGLFILIFSGYVLERKVLVLQLGLTGWSLHCWQYMIRYVSPVLLAIIMINGLI